MNESHHRNTDLLQLACTYLEPLLDRFVLVGGCATDLLITNRASPEVRATIDVDLIVDAISLVDYYDIESSLRNIGFKQGEDDDGVICRWTIENVILDLMPTDKAILGFSNPWYKSAYANAQLTQLPNGLTVRHVTAPYFIATKIEAFNGRGGGDFMMSHDMEDIVSVVDGRAELIGEISACDEGLKSFVSKQFKVWQKNEDFYDALSGHLPPDQASQARLPIIMKSIAQIADLVVE